MIWKLPAQSKLKIVKSQGISPICSGIADSITISPTLNAR